jgi:hypothetical protein
VALVLAGRPAELVEVMLWFGWELEKTIFKPISGKKLRDSPRPVFQTPLRFLETEDNMLMTFYKYRILNGLKYI